MAYPATSDSTYQAAALAIAPAAAPTARRGRDGVIDGWWSKVNGRDSDGRWSGYAGWLEENGWKRMVGGAMVGKEWLVKRWLMVDGRSTHSPAHPLTHPPIHPRHPTPNAHERH